MRVRQLNVKCPFTKISVRYAVILPGLQKHITESASGDLMEDQPLLKFGLWDYRLLTIFIW